jgi:hypothetical protein
LQTNPGSSCPSPVPRRIESLLDGDVAGEGPGLVGEQHLDVAEVLDGDQALMTKIDAVSTPATLTRRPEKSRGPTWKAVLAWCSCRPTATAPKAMAMADPVPTTTPCPAP